MEQPDTHPSARLIGAAPAIHALRAQIERLAAFDQVGGPMVPTFLVQGETGTGKGLVARIIHDSGPARRGPVHPGQLRGDPRDDARGRAVRVRGRRPSPMRGGRSRACSKRHRAGRSSWTRSTPSRSLLQTKLLTAIESKRVRRLGAVAERNVDVKLLAATQVDLRQAVAAGRFREDLYHRLAVVVLTLPPLRDRGDDVVLLAQAFLRRLAAGYGLAPKALTEDALDWLREYRWPGNIRELGHVMERVTLLRSEREVDARALASLVEPPPLEGLRAALPLDRCRVDGPPGGGSDPERPSAGRGQRGAGRASARRQPRHCPLADEAARHRASPPRGAARLGRCDRVGACAGPGRAAIERGVGQASTAMARLGAEDRGRARDRGDLAGGRRPRAAAIRSLDGGGVPASGSSPRRSRASAACAFITPRPSTSGGSACRACWTSCPSAPLQAALAIRRDVEGMSADRRPRVRLALHLGTAVLDAAAAEPMADVLPVGETFAMPVRLLAAAGPGISSRRPSWSAGSGPG